jgi:hypothetical protein
MLVHPALFAFAKAISPLGLFTSSGVDLLDGGVGLHDAGDVHGALQDHEEVLRAQTCVAESEVAEQIGGKESSKYLSRAAARKGPDGRVGLAAVSRTHAVACLDCVDRLNADDGRLNARDAKRP